MDKVCLKKGRELLIYGAVVGAMIAGCGGGGGGSATTPGSVPATTASATIKPYKGAFTSGTIILKDANGAPVTIISGGTVNASGVVDVTYSANVVYPLVVEVTGSYFNENTGQIESSTVPLRSVIASASASSAVPVTIVTETAVADLQNRIGTFSASTPIAAASAVAALDAAGTMLGIPASAVPAFDPVTNKTADADTLRLSALAILANGQTGATLAEQVQTLANTLATLNPASAPVDVISQAAMNIAMMNATANIGASGVVATAPAISTTTVEMINNNANIAATNSIVGSWANLRVNGAAPGFGTPTTTLLNFFTNGYYLHSESVVSGPSVQPGLEYGAYTWNSSTGAFISTCPTVDTNGQAGFSAPTGQQCTAGNTATSTTITVSGNTMTVIDNSTSPASTLTFERVIDANPIVGSWGNLKANGVRPPYLTRSSTLTITFFANGDYMQSQAEVDPLNPSVQAGLEHGTYSWSPSTNLLTPTCPTVDTNNQAGFSAPTQVQCSPAGSPLPDMSVAVNGNILTITDNSVNPPDLLTFDRVMP